jgi:hypothetical protein
MNVIAKAGQRIVETASLCLKQSAELNHRLKAGQVSGRRYVREAAAIWAYNIKNFWHPEEDPVHNASDLVGRRH